MPRTALLATALMLTGLTAACTPEQQQAWDRLAGFDNPPPEPAAVASVAPEPALVAPQRAFVAPEPAPLQYGDPGYVCEPVFRELSCDDDGKPHHLGAQMEWID